MKTLWGFTQALVDRKLMPTAIKVALVVGTILFIINHGSSLLKGKMTERDGEVASPYPPSTVAPLGETPAFPLTKTTLSRNRGVDETAMDF